MCWTLPALLVPLPAALPSGVPPPSARACVESTRERYAGQPSSGSSSGHRRGSRSRTAAGTSAAGRRRAGPAHRAEGRCNACRRAGGRGHPREALMLPLYEKVTRYLVRGDYRMHDASPGFARGECAARSKRGVKTASSKHPAQIDGPRPGCRDRELHGFRAEPIARVDICQRGRRSADHAGRANRPTRYRSCVTGIAVPLTSYFNRFKI